MSRRKPAVGVKRDVSDLIGGGRRSLDADQAIAQGLLFGAKLQGQWLYSTHVDFVERLRDRMATALELTLADWLTGNLVMVAGNARKRVNDIDISSGAARQVTKDLLQRSGRFFALGLLTQNYQPHLAICGAHDREEVDRQVQAATDLIQRQGQVELGDLPDPLLERQLTTWRQVVLEHLEFRGVGWFDGLTLRSW